ncbi:MAG: hypothetical protein M9904_11860 [Chitinophagaceae bacterium]|nr:hypothetical protein [Chitinophagaceae bacterium]
MDRLRKISSNPRLHNQKYSQALSYGLCITKQGTLLISDTNENGGYVFRSTDNGENVCCYRFRIFRSALPVRACAQWDHCKRLTGCIYKSEDDGQSWKLWSRMDTTTALYATEYIRPGTIVQASEKGDVYQSRDDGTSGSSVFLVTPAMVRPQMILYTWDIERLFIQRIHATKVFISYDEGKKLD